MNELTYEAKKVYEMAQIYGGSFEKALFDSLRYADIYNISKIKNTWPDMWAKNLDFYEKAQENVQA